MWIALYLRGINMPWDRIDEFIHMAMKLSAVVTIGALINMVWMEWQNYKSDVTE